MNSDNGIQITKFKPREMLAGKNATMVFIARRRSGKSVLMADLLYYLSEDKIPRCVIFSATEGQNAFYSKYVPDSFIYNSFEENIFNRIIEDQKLLVERQKLGDISSKIDTRMVIVLDDCGFDKKIMKMENLKFLFQNGRHINVTIMMSIQYIYDLPCELRANVDFVFCLKDTSPKNVIKLYECYMGVFGNIHTFRKALDQSTQNFECLIYDNTKQTTVIRECCFWYKGLADREFKFGPKALWDYHSSKYIPARERLHAQLKVKMGQGENLLQR